MLWDDHCGNCEDYAAKSAAACGAETVIRQDWDEDWSECKLLETNQWIDLIRLQPHRAAAVCSPGEIDRAHCNELWRDFNDRTISVNQPTVRERNDSRWAAEQIALVLCSAQSVSQSLFTITGKAPTRVFSWLKAQRLLALSHLRHYSKQAPKHSN